MGDSGDQLRIAQLAGTAVPSLARCQLVGVELAGASWGLVGPAGGGSDAAPGEVAGVLQRLGRQGGAVAAPAMAPGWVWAYPMQRGRARRLPGGGRGGRAAGRGAVRAAVARPADRRGVAQRVAAGRRAGGRRGGALTVASTEGEGTTFTLGLSLAMEPA